MGWERRWNKRYYYRARKVNGRVVKEYVGTGEVAELAARLDAEAANVRALQRVERLRTRAELEELDATLEEIDRAVDTVVSAAMALAGFHRHRGEWRRKRTVATTETTDTAPAPTAPPSPGELLRRAQAGDAGAMRLVMPLLDDPKALDVLGGNVPLRAAQVVIRQIAGRDLVSEEAIQRKMDLLRAELAGPNPGPVEQLVVDRVVSLWLQLHKLEGEAAMVGTTDAGRAGFYQRAMSAAQARYFHAIRELTSLRRHAQA